MRDLGGSGQHNKFLTQNQLDRWLFEGEKGETIIAHLASKEFDPDHRKKQTRFDWGKGPAWTKGARSYADRRK